MAETWLRCTECKKDIPFGGKHYLCSVSTCKRSKFRLVFCTPVCWDSHLSSVRHREAWAEDAVAPSRDAWAKELAAEAQSSQAPTPAPRPAVSTPALVGQPAVRRVVGEASPQVAAQLEGLKLSEVTDKDVLIVVSKMKKYIKDRSGFNVSDAIADVLSDHVRLICDDSIRNAARDERKTVLDRDVPRPRR